MPIPAGEVWDAVRAAVAGHSVRRIAAGNRPRAAVLLPLLPFVSGPALLFTVRSHEVEHHKGEISFPGGAADPADGHPCRTALRELQEEVGVHPDHVELLGELSHQVTRSEFHVTPFVGILDRAPYPYRPSATEVAALLEVPLGHLLDPANREQREVLQEGQRRRVCIYHWRRYRIHGATAAILGTFLDAVTTQLK